METLRRTLHSFLVRDPFHRSLLAATYDDILGVEDADLQVILETLLGCSKGVSSLDAIDAISERMRDNFQWKVILKCLIILHFVIDSPTTTPQWVATICGDMNVFRACQDYREPASSSPQTLDHAEMVRMYSKFIESYAREMSRPRALAAKHTTLSSVPPYLAALDADAFLSEMRRVNALLDGGLSIFVQEGKVEPTKGFCELTLSVLRLVYKTLVRLYGLGNSTVIKLCERVGEDFVAADRLAAVECYEDFRQNAKEIAALCDHMRTMPGLNTGLIPHFEEPPRVDQSPLASCCPPPPTFPPAPSMPLPPKSEASTPDAPSPPAEAVPRSHDLLDLL